MLLGGLSHEAQWVCYHLVDYTMWKVLPVTHLGPVSAFAMFGEDAKEAIGEGRCVSVCTQDALTLLEFSACSGFPGLTIQHLSDLAH